MDIISLLSKNKTIEAFKNNEVHDIITDDVIGTAFLVASKYQAKREKMIVVTSNLYNSQRLYDILNTLIGEEDCLFFPYDELLRNDAVAVSKEMVSQRIYVLNEMLQRDSYVVITHTTGFLKYLPAPELFSQKSIRLKVGEDIDLASVKKLLTELGYTSVHKIDHSMQFASRGEILDIFSVNSDNPVRIELFDTQIESIRYFSLETQVSFAEISEFTILPADITILNEHEEQNIANKIREQAKMQTKQLSDANISCFKNNMENVIETLVNNHNPNIMNKYYGFLQDKHYTISDYAPKSEIVFANEEQIINCYTVSKEEIDRYVIEELKEHRILNNLSFYADIQPFLRRKNVCRIHEFVAKRDNYLSLEISSIAGVATNITQAINIIENYLQNARKIIIALDNVQQCEIIKTGLTDRDIKYQEMTVFSVPNAQIGIVQCRFDEGFELINQSLVVLTSKELFSFKSKHNKFSNRYKEAVAISSEKDLEPGDYVVHEQHGVGRFIDVITLEVNKVHRDFIHIQYAGTDVLYVPLEQFSLIRKFVGKEGAVPKLNKLGSGEWDKTKKKIKERINEMADRLFKLYVNREQENGFAFKKDDEFQYQFEQQFPHILTKDQEKCLEEIKKDMESPKPMDRLLCGDVGFGKTEIAFRAAFKAILSGKQVAILCPTTLLCRQHYERAMERFGPFDVRIAVFSRLIDDQRQKHYIEQVKDGSCHLIIGTHRLLSKEISFKNLGLLIIDEEQRFGVEQKELIKELKKNVDVLTLTATPIPRTLQMSLVGIRSLSQINTAPENRMPIQTYVMPQKDELIIELISKELARNGQVFYLHNQVSDIYSVAVKLEKKLKGAVVGIAHGQMDKETIEDVMLKFYNGEIDVLVCTSIIETGIDIPNVNMIIIENADKFGLSQLYQIKGRVGRGNRIAYAYLLYKPNKVLNDNARKRLKAISDFTELGSGYKIAQRDLLIRGAGDILGPEQAGFIDTVGIDMYMEMLQEAMIERENNGGKPKTKKSKGNIAIDAYLPSEYVEKGDKINLYKEIENVKSLDELHALKEKIKDIYGKMPPETNELFAKREIMVIIENDEAFDKIADQNDYIDLYLSEKFSNVDGIGMILFRAFSDYLKYLKVVYVNRQIKIRVFKNGKWFTILRQLVETTSNIHNTLQNDNKSDLKG